MIALLVTNIFPLYILIAMGYFAAKYLDVNLHSMAVIAIYFLSPVVVFGAISKLEFQAAYLLLPVVLFFISAFIGVFSYLISQKLFASKLANLIGMTSTNGNSGYFGLPIVLALFGPSALGVYLMMTTFIELSTNTVGYYLLARGNFSIKESLLKVCKLPPLYGMVLGLVWSFAGWGVPDIFYTYWDHFSGAWVVIGMMLIGVAMGKMPFFKFNIKLISVMMAVRYIVWPIATMSVVLLDRHVLGMFDGQIHTLLLLLGVVPHAANAVAYASQLEVCPEDTATVVLISTAFAILYVPLAFFVLGAPF